MTNAPIAGQDGTGDFGVGIGCSTGAADCAARGQGGGDAGGESGAAGSSGASNSDSDELCDGLDNDGNPATADSCPKFCEAVPATHPYMRCLAMATYAEAAEACAAQSMSLVQVDDADENTFVHGMVSPLAFAWIGGTDAEEEDVWLFPDGTNFRKAGTAVPGTFNNWRVGEPNDMNDEDCLGMFANDATWNDFDCQTTSGFICERQ